MATDDSFALRMQVRDVVFEALDTLNEHRAPTERLPKALDTPLAGDGGSLDSLAFVSLIVGLEQRLEEKLGKTVNFFQDEHLDPTAGPFRSVQTLIDHLEALLSRSGDA